MSHFFDTVRQWIQAVMQGRKTSAYAEKLLYAFSLVYGTVPAIRAWMYRKNILESRSLPCFVISIGNITAGGTGKSPMTVYLAKMLRDRGFRVVILSRGYGGSHMKKGGIVSNGQSVLMSADEAGDEPYMMARSLRDVPVLVGRNRCKNGMLAIRLFDPDVILLDDGYQHLQLKRDLDLLLLDCENPLGNGHVLPRGMLREPLSALSRAQGIVLTRCETTPVKALPNPVRSIPVFRSRHIPYLCHITDEQGQTILHPNGQKKWDISVLKDRRVFLFSGIARNDLFFRTVEAFGCTVAGSKEFPDHYFYCAADMQEIVGLAKKRKAELIVTTEKDFVRVPPAALSGKMRLAVIGIEISFGNDADAFAGFIREKLNPHRS
ncbi:MAG: tetraacyldisaccharide 4'-kinase [Desulfobacterales bacterium]